MKTLIIRPDAIGDFVLTLPMIQALKSASPVSEITVLVHPRTADLARVYPCIDEIIEIINNITATHSGLIIQYLNVGFLFK